MLTIHEAAHVTGRSVDWLRRLCREGRLAARHGSGGEWLIDAASLDAVRGIPRRKRRRPFLLDS